MAEGSDREPLRVLVAEDDAASRRRLEATLERWGFEVIAARDGREALARFREARPHVALLDWLMPHLDGVDVCREIRAMPGGDAVQLILISSRATRSDVVEALESGADGHLAKPWQSAELRAHLAVAERLVRRTAAGRSELEAGEHLPSGLVAMCSYCRNVREEPDRWMTLEHYLFERSALRFTHGICPVCYEAARAEISGLQEPEG